MGFVGEIFALSTAICWAAGSLLFAFATRRIGALSVNAFRIPIAALIISLLCAALQGYIWPTGASIAQLGWLTLSAVFGLAIGDWCHFEAMHILGPRIASLLAASTPIFAALISWLTLGQDLRLISIGGIAVTLAGLAWVSLERNVKTFGARAGGSKRIGYLLAGVGALGQSLGLVTAKLGMLDNVTALSASSVRLVAASVVTWAIVLARGRSGKIIESFSDRRAWLAMLAAALIGPVAGIWMSLLSIQYTKVGIAATLMSTTPLFVIPLVMLVHRERPSARAILGTIVTVAGVAILLLT